VVRRPSHSSLTSTPTLHIHDPEKTPAARTSTDSTLEMPPDGAAQAGSLFQLSWCLTPSLSLGRGKPHLYPSENPFGAEAEKSLNDFTLLPRRVGREHS
jgi:hypothetical protein